MTWANDTLIHVPDVGLAEDFALVVTLHGLGDNYPDNFQVSHSFVSCVFSFWEKKVVLKNSNYFFCHAPSEAHSTMG
jgi:hypothetical protein